MTSAALLRLSETIFDRDSKASRDVSARLSARFSGQVLAIARAKRLKDAGVTALRRRSRSASGSTGRFAGRYRAGGCVLAIGARPGDRARLRARPGAQGQEPARTGARAPTSLRRSRPARLERLSARRGGRGVQPAPSCARRCSCAARPVRRPCRSSARAEGARRRWSPGRRLRPRPRAASSASSPSSGSGGSPRRSRSADPDSLDLLLDVRHLRERPALGGRR